MNRGFLVAVGLVVAGTIGAGIFSLPFVFQESGWFVGLSYLIGLSAVMIFAHTLYLRVLESENERERFVGLVRRFLGNRAFFVAVFLTIVGLSLGLTGDFVIGGAFFRALFPGIGAWAPFAFWGIASFPLLFGIRKLSFVEALGTVGILGAIILLFFFAPEPVRMFSFPAVHTSQMLLPFGSILFALAGWTAIEPILESRKKYGDRGSNRLAIVVGTLIVAILYFLFVLAVLGTDGSVATDVVSHISFWPRWKQILISLAGLLGLLNVYRLVVLEAKNALLVDLRVPKFMSFAIALGLPPMFFFLGFNDFGRIVGFVGGVFLALEYVFIVLVAKKALVLRGASKLLANVVIVLFSLGAFYELYHFLVRP